MKLKELLGIIDPDTSVFVFDSYSSNTLEHGTVAQLPGKYNDCEVERVHCGHFVNITVKRPRTYSSCFTDQAVREWHISFSNTEDMLEVYYTLEEDWSCSVYDVDHDSIANLYFICSDATFSAIEETILCNRLGLQEEVH